MNAVFPSRSLLLLMTIGIADLVSTAWLFHAGLIYERNPLMRVLLNQGEWLFIVVKGATLVIAWYIMARYAKKNYNFVKKTCLLGSCAYILLWCSWFFSK